MGRLGTGFVNFLSILPLALGTITGGGFFVGGGDIARDLTSQSLVEFVLPFGDTVPRYLASPLLFLCTVAGLRNSDELFATSTDMVSLFFLIYRHISQHTWINDETFDSNFLTISRLREEIRAFHRRWLAQNLYNRRLMSCVSTKKMPSFRQYCNELDKCTSLSDVETHSHQRHDSRPKSSIMRISRTVGSRYRIS